MYSHTLSRKEIIMKRFIVSFLLIVVLCFCLASPIFALEEDQHNKYIPDGYVGIYTEAQLKAINNNTSEKYILMNDIVVANDWVPLDNFTGVFDGNGYSISNLKNTNCEGFGGLFSTNEGTIKNVNILDSTFTFNGSKGAYFHCGAICGRNFGTVENCSGQNIKITFTTKDFDGSGEGLLGGIVGWNEYGTIRYCFASNISISGKTTTNGSSSNYYLNDAGGVVGFSRGGVINDCIVVNSIMNTECSIKNYEYIRCGAGGICGQARSNASINNCYSLFNTLQSTSSSGDILGIDAGASTSNNQTQFDGKLPNGFNTQIWGVRGIYNYPVIIMPQNYICSNGHTADGNWVVNQEVDCESNGERIQKCSVCGKVAKVEVTESEGHIYGDFTIISGNKLIPPIVKERKCDVCRNIETVTDWSYIWVTVVACIVTVGVVIGLIGYIRAFKKK